MPGPSPRSIASKSRPPAIAASRVSLVIRSMLTPWLLRVDDSSRTMPGRSLPSTSNVRRWAGAASVGDVTAGNGHRDETFDVLEGGAQGVGALGRDRDLDDAREGSGELGELAVLPVAAVGVDDRGDRGHESRTIVADDGEHKRCHAFSVASEPSRGTCEPACEPSTRRLPAVERPTRVRTGAVAEVIAAS